MPEIKDQIEECGLGDGCTMGINCYRDNNPPLATCLACLCFSCTRARCKPAVDNHHPEAILPELAEAKKVIAKDNPDQSEEHIWSEEEQIEMERELKENMRKTITDEFSKDHDKYYTIAMNQHVIKTRQEEIIRTQKEKRSAGLAIAYIENMKEHGWKFWFIGEWIQHPKTEPPIFVGTDMEFIELAREYGIPSEQITQMIEENDTGV